MPSAFGLAKVKRVPSICLILGKLHGSGAVILKRLLQCHLSTDRARINMNPGEWVSVAGVGVRRQREAVTDLLLHTSRRNLF